MNDIIDRLKSLPPSTNLDTILTSCVEMGASRIHLQTDTSPSRTMPRCRIMSRT